MPAFATGGLVKSKAKTNAQAKAMLRNFIDASSTALNYTPGTIIQARSNK